jgi:hypothetical protein
MKTSSRERRFSFRIYHLAFFICFFGTGCNLFGPKASDKIPKHQAPVSTTHGTPDAKTLIGYLNREAAKLNSIESRDLTIDVKAPAGNVSLDSGSLVVQKPRSMKMVGRKMGMQQVLVGSNDERFWFHVKRDPSDALYHCTYTDYEKGVDLPFPFQPEWVVDALGMSPIGESPGAQVKEDKTTFRLIEDTTVQGRPAKKVTVFYKGETQGDQPQVISRTVYDSADRIVFVATTHKVHRVPTTGSRPLIVPEVIELEWPAQKTSLVIDLGSATKVNTPIGREAFQMPQLGSRQIDLGRDRPTGRGVIPARYR